MTDNDDNELLSPILFNSSPPPPPRATASQSETASGLNVVRHVCGALLRCEVTSCGAIAPRALVDGSGWRVAPRGSGHRCPRHAAASPPCVCQHAGANVGADVERCAGRCAGRHACIPVCVVFDGVVRGAPRDAAVRAHRALWRAQQAEQEAEAAYEAAHARLQDSRRAAVFATRECALASERARRESARHEAARRQDARAKLASVSNSNSNSDSGSDQPAVPALLPRRASPDAANSAKRKRSPSPGRAHGAKRPCLTTLVAAMFG